MYLRIAFFLIVMPSLVLQAQDNNYQYDANGRLTADLSEGIIKIEWGNNGKVTRIVRADTCHTPDIEFAYNAQGYRIMKLVKPRNGSGLTPESKWTYTYYIPDMDGNCMVSYE